MADMRHMEFLETVKNADVQTLREKEATYQGSWKAAGGRSAWFMLRRNMDRLMVMMAPKPWPESFSFEDMIAMRDAPGEHVLDRDNVEHMIDLVTQEDIFRKIEEHPQGEDGTVLACIRDLRCYLTLVEAEMMSRGAPGPSMSQQIKEAGERRRQRKEIVDNVVASGDQINRIVNRFLSWRLPENFSPDGGISFKKHGNEGTPHQYVNSPTGTNLFDFTQAYQMVEYLLQGEEVIEPLVPRLREQPPYKPGTPEDGGHHGSMSPWIIDRKPGRPELDVFYKQLTPVLWVLEPIVLSRVLPRELVNYYELNQGRREYDDPDAWTVVIKNVPDGIRSFFPTVKGELNAKEFEESRYRVLYDLEGEKYVLRGKHESWSEQSYG